MKGSFCIYNLTNNMRYLDSTEDIFRRVDITFDKLKNNKYVNLPEFQSDFNDNNGEDFYVLICPGDSKESASIIREHMIRYNGIYNDQFRKLQSSETIVKQTFTRIPKKKEKKPKTGKPIKIDGKLVLLQDDEKDFNINKAIIAYGKVYHTIQDYFKENSETYSKEVREQRYHELQCQLKDHNNKNIIYYLEGLNATEISNSQRDKIRKRR